MIGDGCKLVWAQDEAGEIGKRPALESHLFEISAETFDLLRAHTAATSKRGRK